MENNSMAMGARIREQRHQLRMTLRELSKRCGVKESALGNLEQRDSKKSDRVAAIAAALGVSTSWLLDGISDFVNVPRREDEAEMLALWRVIEPEEREELLSVLRTRVAGYRKIAAHLANIGFNLEAPKVHAAPYPSLQNLKKKKP